MPSVTSTATTRTDSATTNTTAITPSGVNRLVLGLAFYQGTTNPSSATAGGNAMTAIGHVNDFGGDARLSWYYYVAPAASSINVVFTWAAAPTFADCAAITLDDVDQATPIRASSFNSAAVNDGGAGSVVISSASGDLVISGLGGYSGGNAITPNNTEVFEFDPEPGGFVLGVQSAAGAASVTTSWAALIGRSTVAGFSVQPAAASSITRTYLYHQPKRLVFID